VDAALLTSFFGDKILQQVRSKRKDLLAELTCCRYCVLGYCL
jgi:hypothetical protein